MDVAFVWTRASLDVSLLSAVEGAAVEAPESPSLECSRWVQSSGSRVSRSVSGSAYIKLCDSG